MMRTPAAVLLICSWLVACGQSGNLYRPDESAKVPPVNPVTSGPAGTQGTPAEQTDEGKKDEEKKEEDAAGPASTPAADSTVPSTSKPSTATP